MVQQATFKADVTGCNSTELNQAAPICTGTQSNLKLKCEHENTSDKELVSC